jgi:integrase/recombinase XerD
MFDQLFERPHALHRQRTAPLADDRRRYVVHCIEQGMARSTVRLVAELLIGVEKYLKLAERPNSIISLQEIKEAGTCWASRKAGPPMTLLPELSRQRFIREAARWLAFMKRLQYPNKSTKPYEDRIVEFANFMLHERGLAVATIEQRCHTVCEFLDELCERERSLQDVTVSEVDSILAHRVNQGHYARASVQTCASSLRSFFRFAEARRWCREGIAASIMAPRVFQQESLPSAPSWSEVQKLLRNVDGDTSSAIRDRSILMVLAIYGVRAGEVVRLQLGDINWEEESIVFTCSKRLGKHRFPLVQSVGDSIIRYLQEVRPLSPHREVFLTLRAPFRPLTAGTLWPVVGRRLRAVATSIKHHGPHALRHACATRLINEGLSLKEVGDHLGHRGLETTRIYAKVDMVRLRQVASFDLGGLL